jgi:transposase-like protein
MKKKYRVAPEVREQILKRVKEEGVSVEAAAKDAGIHHTTIYGWLGKGATAAPSWSEYAKLRRENKALLELVGQVTLQLSESQKKN